MAETSASLIQSNGTTSQLITASPCRRASASTASSIVPPPVRASVGRCPVVASIASLVPANCAAISCGGNVVMSGCDQVWLPISMPAPAIRAAAAGSAATLSPIRKNVARAWCSRRICSNRSV